MLASAAQSAAVYSLSTRGSNSTLAYAAGDVNAGVNPHVTEAAYTHNDNNPATATTLSCIDDFLDALVVTSNPNGGTLNTVGSLGFNVDEYLGFDIFTNASGINMAFASLRVAGAQGLCAINLASGAASLIGGIGSDQLNGLAVTPCRSPARWC